MARLFYILPLVALSTASQAINQTTEAPSPRCLSLDRVISRTPLPPDHVRFEMSDGTVYLSRPVDRCNSLTRAGRQDILVLEADGSQICSGDRVRIVDPAEARAGGMRAFPSCRLGPFVAQPRT